MNHQTSQVAHLRIGPLLNKRERQVMHNKCEYIGKHSILCTQKKKKNIYEKQQHKQVINQY